MSNTKLLGLTGPAGAGKDYIFERLNAVYMGRAKRIALADEVRREVSTEVLYALRVSNLVPYSDLGTWAKPYTEAQRKLLQVWGTEVRRSEDPDYWIKKASLTLRLMLSEAPPLIVVTDIRFENEAEWIRARGGIVAQVQATDATRKRRLGGVAAPDHASEELKFERDADILNEYEPYLDLKVYSHLFDPFLLYPVNDNLRRLNAHGGPLSFFSV